MGKKRGVKTGLGVEGGAVRRENFTANDSSEDRLPLERTPEKRCRRKLEGSHGKETGREWI